MNRLAAIASLILMLPALSAVARAADEASAPQRALTSRDISLIIHEATDSLEARNPDVTEYAYYHVMPDGSTRSFTKLSAYDRYEKDARLRAEVEKLVSLFDSVAPNAVDYDMGRPTLIKTDDRRILNFKSPDERLNRQLELSRRYQDPRYYQQTIDLLVFQEKFFQMSHFWRTDADPAYAGAVDLSDLEKEFARLLDEYGTQVEKVRFDDDDGYAGVLRLRPNTDMHITGTLLCMPFAGVGDWVKLYRMMWNHFGDKGQMSFSYNRSRDIYITDYSAKKIYAVSYVDGKMYFLKAIYDERPFLPNDWRIGHR